MESTVKYGQEIGPNLKKIGKKLSNNDNLIMLLDNTDLDPLNKVKHPNNIDGVTVMKNKLIRFVPLLTPEEQTTKSKIVLIVDTGTIPNGNLDNENLSFEIHVFCPFNEWIIAGEDLRPFAIMSEIRKTIQDKRINGLGEIKYKGFRLATLTEQMGSYIMRFDINAFS